MSTPNPFPYGTADEQVQRFLAKRAAASQQDQPVDVQPVPGAEPELTVEQKEIALQGITVPFDCAYQYEYTHSYTEKPWTPRTVYKYDGVDVYVDGVPIDDEVLAHNAHYGHLGQAGPYENKSVRKLVKGRYHSHFTKCQLARSMGFTYIPPMPEPFHFYVTYCGN